MRRLTDEPVIAYIAHRHHLEVQTLIAAFVETDSSTVHDAVTNMLEANERAIITDLLKLYREGRLANG